MTMSDSTFPLFPVFAGLGFILPLIPLSWHLQAWNSGTCYYMIWASLACLNQFVNSIVWHANAFDPAPIWCDISTRIMLAASVGLPASSLAINRRLYRIASIQSVAISLDDKKRAVLIDTLLCVLFPLVYTALQYIVQGHRFNIFEDIGCFPAIYNSLPAYFLNMMWPILIGLISAIYCTLSLVALSRRRMEFSQFMAANKSLTFSRYFRLMALAMTEMLLTTPLAAVVIWINVELGVQPWISLANTHIGFSRVDQIPRIIWSQSHLLTLALELTRWVTPLCSFVFFIFFGFAEEARRNYRSAFHAVSKHLPKSIQIINFRRRPNAETSLPFFKVSSPPAYSSSPSSSIFPLPQKQPMSDGMTTVSSFDSSSLAPVQTDPAVFILPPLVSPPFEFHLPTHLAFQPMNPVAVQDTETSRHSQTITEIPSLPPTPTSASTSIYDDQTTTHSFQLYDSLPRSVSTASSLY